MCACGVACVVLNAYDRPLVELCEVVGDGVGAGAAQPGGNGVDQVLDTGAVGIEVAAGGGDALFEEGLAGPVERDLSGGSEFDGPGGGHPEAFLVEPAVVVALRVSGRLVCSDEPRPDHHVGRPGGEGEGDIAGVTGA